MLQEKITLVFSDIEGSTQLAQKLKEHYPALLEKERRTIRNALTKYQGKEIDTAGDGFFMAFENPLNAILAVAEMQMEFQTQSWATQIGLKVRMGVHTGTVLQSGTGYTGVEVHFAARICSAAYGEQVLLSRHTQELLPELMDGGVLTTQDLGEFFMPGFDDPVKLYQLNISGLKNKFPGPRIGSYEKKIAIMPFRSEFHHIDQEYIGYGIAEEIIIALGKVKGLRVASRSTSFAIKDRDIDAREIGEKLKVDTLLEGRVNVNQGQFEIKVELIDTKTGLDIWSKKYTGSGNQLAQIQDDIIRNLIEASKINIQTEFNDAVQNRQSHVFEAYDFYLRGRRFYLKFSNQSIELALHMFQKAIKADTSYALAYAGLADCYSFQFQHKANKEEIINLADEASKIAVQLGPNIAEVYVSRGIVLDLQKKYSAAEESFQYAIERDPSLFLGWYHYGRMCFANGNFAKAARLFEQANRVEPEDYQSLFLAAQTYHDSGCHDLSLNLRKRGVEIAEQFIKLNPGDTRALYLTANALVFLDQPQKSIKYAQQALMIEPHDSMLLYNVACVYALLGMKEEALACAERSFQAGLTMLRWYEHDSNLDSIRDDPRFEKLLEKIRETSTK